MKRIGWWWVAALAGLVVLLVLLLVSRSQYSDLQADLDAAETQNSNLSSQLSQAQSDKSLLQADYDELNADYDEVSQELADIQEVYPPRDFSSAQELRDWLLANDISEKPITTTSEDWYGRALEVQADALKDGYIVSVDFDYDSETDTIYVYCVTVINSYIWFWDPETDESFPTGIGPVK